MGASAKDWHFDNPREQALFEQWEREFAPKPWTRAWDWLVRTFEALPPSTRLHYGIMGAGPVGMWACLAYHRNQERRGQ